MSGKFSRQVISLASSLKPRAATEQGGLLSGVDPTEVNTSDPIRLWIIQMGLIILTAQLLALGLRRLREPKVISEVLGGIILGPTAFGRIPGFTEHIFPEDSLPFLSLTANIGLVLFLFLVGLEIETSVIKKNARYSMPIALGGMALPFGLGAALAVPIYHEYIDEDTTSYTHFMLFTGVAFSITAFPVLCRILTELKLVDTTVGIVVLSAGVGNDIIGWTLLALAVALVNASAGLSALWILLTAVAWTLFLLFPVKFVFKWLAKRTGSIENGPTMTFMTATILMVFASAFFTDVIGVHAIFGGFLAGLVVPREGGLAITLTEKLEDMVSIIFLPLYFTLSGLSTNLGLLDNGITWGYTIAICCLAFFGKFFGCSITSKLCGFSTRESSVVGALMSCKGLVELIVLNVGLNAGILTQRVFSMFVFEALVLTCITTPLVLLLYPEHKRTRATATGPDYIKPSDGEKGAGRIKRRFSEDVHDEWKSRFTVVLDKLEHLPGMMTLTQLIHPQDLDDFTGTPEKAHTDLMPVASGSRSGSDGAYAGGSPATIDVLRLMELSDRTSAVMKSSAADQLIRTDPLLNVFKTFGNLNNLPMSTSLSIVTFDDMAHTVANRAYENDSQLVLVPWLPPSASMTSSDAVSPQTPAALTPFLNPFDMLFRSQNVDKSASIVHSQFIRSVFSQCDTDVALFVDRTRNDATDSHSGHVGKGHGQGGRQHIILPFFGGPDDRLALEFVVQLCANPKISATILRLAKTDSHHETTSGGGPLVSPEMAHFTSGSGSGSGDIDPQTLANIRANTHSVSGGAGISGHPDTVYGHPSTQVRMQSETADNILWSRYARPSEDEDHPRKVQEALMRVSFEEKGTPEPLHALIEEVRAGERRLSDEAHLNLDRERTRTGSGPRGSTLVVVGRSRRMAVEDHHRELKKLAETYGNVGGEVRKTVGDVASALVMSGSNVGIVVMQAASREI